jgi:YfiH family protein
VNAPEAGSGAFAATGGPPLPRTDALLTCEPDTPLMLFFADCVPIVLVAPGPCVAVVHAGWRGALVGIAERSVLELARAASCYPSEIDAYVGPHIGPCHYEVDERLLSQFVNRYGTCARAESGGLDLGFVVAASLQTAGVDSRSIAGLGTCTAETNDRFYSYRAEAGRTGRHCALASVVSHS